MKITIVRTNPEQGKPVVATVWEEDRKLGRLEASFDTWIQLEKLVKEGQDWRKRTEAQPRIEVEFKVAEVPTLAEVKEDAEIRKVSR